ncbi:MAG TPA: hypothetical protein VMS12_09890 [Thermoanaerobaculia bacterium]|nr:hypothetical protein [Thermoanaerobaculia bacterium]
MSLPLLLAIGYSLVLSGFAHRSLVGKLRSTHARVDALLTALLAGLVLLAPVLAIAVNSWISYVVFVLLKLILLFTFVILGSPDRIRWSSSRAGLLFFVVYAFVLPASLQHPMNGDEPYYLLLTDSMVRDFDLDLTNQYNAVERPFENAPSTPQAGDPVGDGSERYSRHEPFLSFLLIPGYLAGGRIGASLVLALFGALLVRSTMRMMEEEGIQQRIILLMLPFFAFGPPVIFYATRIWTEVPAAFFFVEAVRAMRHRRPARMLIALLSLCLLQLRFVLVAFLLILRVSISRQFPLWLRIGALAAPLCTLLFVWIITGTPLHIHEWWELMPREPERYAKGVFGLLLDGAGGIAFQAPILLLGVLGIARWSQLPESVRLGMFSSIAYLLLLVIRDEWHGGWSPPLRYVVFLTPFLLLSAAGVLERSRSWVFVGLAGAWTALLTVRGVALPWTLFRIADGENPAGIYLSRLYGSDFSRLFPSFIRPNTAALAAAIIVVVVFILFSIARPMSRGRRRVMAPLGAALAASLLTACLVVGQMPGSVVQFEDAHLDRTGGSLDPPEYTVARFRFRGGWSMDAGDHVSFLYRGGHSRLHYMSAQGADLSIGGVALVLAPTGDAWGEVAMTIPGGDDERVQVTVTRGSVTLDRLEAAR